MAGGHASEALGSLFHSVVGYSWCLSWSYVLGWQIDYQQTSIWGLGIWLSWYRTCYASMRTWFQFPSPVKSWRWVGVPVISGVQGGTSRRINGAWGLQAQLQVSKRPCRMGSMVDSFCHLYCAYGGIQNAQMHITDTHTHTQRIKLKEKSQIAIKDCSNNAVSPGVEHTQQVIDTF